MQIEIRAAPVNQVDFSLARNHWVTLTDRPRCKVIRLDAVPDISTKERLVDTTLFPYLSWLCKTVTAWELVGYVEPAEDLSYVLLLCFLFLTRVCVILCAQFDIQMLLHESLAPKIASRHSDRKLCSINHRSVYFNSLN